MILDVHLEGVSGPIGELSSDPDVGIAFRYLTDRLPHPISVSMPVREEPYGDVASRGFFENLLFENEMRDQVMQRHGIAERDVVGLLYHLGTDCPGAISCVPRGAPPGKRPGSLADDYVTLDGSPVLERGDEASGRPVDPGSDLGRLMRSLRDSRRLPPERKDPSPLAGVQGKIALTLLPDGRLALPAAGGGAPTTHILKVPRAGAMSAVLREHQAMGLMAEVQSHPVAATRVIGEGDLQGLLVERFDRTVSDGAVRRIHQEDFCQALGLGHFLKYERNGIEGRRFTARAVGDLLRLTKAPGAARLAFLEITIAHLVLGNSDNHAKNHALLYLGSKPVLAPAYDVDPVLLDDVTHEMAFRIGRARIADDVETEDIAAFLVDLGFSGKGRTLHPSVPKVISALIDEAKSLPGPGRNRLTDVVFQQARHLSRNLGLDLEVPEADLVVVNR